MQIPQTLQTAPIRWGVLGAANIGVKRVIPAILASASEQLVAVASRNILSAREKFAHLPNLRLYGDYDSLLNDPEIDAIYNPLPNSLHAEWTIKAMEAGKHVLCEKPLASNADEARAMADAAARCDRLLFEAFHYRYPPLAARLKAIIDSGVLGTVRHIETVMCIPLILPGDIRYRWELAGGATMDVGR